MDFIKVARDCSSVKCVYLLTYRFIPLFFIFGKCNNQIIKYNIFTAEYAQYYLNNQPIPLIKCVRYFRILIDIDRWLSHIINKTRKLKSRIRLLRPLLTFMCMKLPNKLLLRPKWTYGIQLWDVAKIFNITASKDLNLKFYV